MIEDEEDILSISKPFYRGVFSWVFENFSLCFIHKYACVWLCWSINLEYIYSDHHHGVDACLMLFIICHHLIMVARRQGMQALLLDVI